MKLSRVIVLVVFLGILAMATHVSIDSDTWWHLGAGRWMIENERLIQEDVFSYTSGGKPWQYPGPWIQILMFKIYDWFGAGGLNLWVSLLVVSIFFFVWETTEGNELMRAVILILASMASAIYWAARPYLITYLIFAVYFFLLERYYRQGKGKLWLLPILMVIWVNSHGGFLAGFLLLGPYLLEVFLKWWLHRKNKTSEFLPLIQRQFPHLFSVGGLMLIGSIISPQGLKLWTLPFTTVSRQAEQMFIAEWQSPDFHDPTLLPFALMLVLSIVFLGGAKKRLNIYELLLMAGFGLMGLISVRNIFFFVIIAPAILSRTGQAMFSELSKDLNMELRVDFSQPPSLIGKVINFILLAVVGIVVLLRVVSFLPHSINDEELRNQFPVAATEFLKNEILDGRMFNTYNYGGYLIWALPENPVFVDGRADLHQDEVILTWYRVINGSDEWKEVFETWEINFVVVEPGVPLLAELEDTGWSTIYRDDLTVIAVSPLNTR